MTSAKLLSLVCVSLVTLGSRAPRARDGVEIEVGKPAPEFILRDQDDREVKLSSFRGKKAVLLAFYPRDFSGGCTQELKGLRAEHDLFVKSGVQVLGISTDGIESHKKFAEALELPFPLLADAGGKVSKTYGILIVTPKGDLLSGRSVFLIDAFGIVRYADSKYALRPADDREALYKAIRSLQGGTVPAEAPRGDTVGAAGARVEAPAPKAREGGRS